MVVIEMLKFSLYKQALAICPKSIIAMKKPKINPDRFDGLSGVLFY